MKEYNLNDIINLGNINTEVKYLTLNDLYNLYEKQQMISLVKIVNGNVKLFLEEEE
jgi:hypothetical protein